MDPRLLDMMKGGPGNLPPGIPQIKTFTRSVEEAGRLDADANGFLVDLPREVKIVDFRLLLTTDRLAAVFVLHVPLPEGLK